MKKTLLYITIIFILSSCYSYRSNFKGAEMKNEFAAMPKQEAFVTNKDQNTKEYRILKKSNLYQLTDDSTCTLKIELGNVSPKIFINCITGQVMVLGLTLGQLPVKIPERYFFEYRELQNNNIDTINLDLSFAKRIWFWDMFSPQKSLNKALAKEIRYNKVKSRKPLSTTNRSISTK